MESSCPICTKDLQTEDTNYPLLCNTDKCHFNMCTDCTTNLLHAATNNDDENPNQASDGNTYKLQLQCPSCRSSKFEVSIVDILLLRVDDVDRRRGVYDKADSQLSAKDLRTKYDQERLNNIQKAKKRYDDGLKRMTSMTASMRNLTIKDIMNTNEKDTTDDNDQRLQLRQKKKEFLDTMLFSGLHGSMTTSECTYVKELMTSGSTTKLVQASYILAGIMDMNTKGGTPTVRLKKTKSKDIKKLQLRKTKSEGVPGGGGIGGNGPGTGSSNRYKSYEEKIKIQRTRSPIITTAIHNQSELQLETKQRNQWRRLYPIPCRMPRIITLNLDFDIYARWWRCPLIFADDETSFLNLRSNVFHGQDVSNDVRSNLVRDSFEEISFGITGTMFKVSSDNVCGGGAGDGIENILSVLNDDDIHDDAPSITIPWRRVVVSSVKGNTFRCGIKPGDVITHVEGEPFDGNAEKLRLLLLRKQQEFNSSDRYREGEFPTCQLVVNAEVGVAEALRLRNIVAELL